MSSNIQLPPPVACQSDAGCLAPSGSARACRQREAEGNTRRKTVLKAEQQGADLLPDACPLMHSVRRLLMGWTPRPDPRSSPSSARHCLGRKPPRDIQNGGTLRKTGICPRLDALRGHWSPWHLLLPKAHTTSEKSHSGQRQGRVPLNRHVDRQTEADRTALSGQTEANDG